MESEENADTSDEVFEDWSANNMNETLRTTSIDIQEDKYFTNLSTRTLQQSCSKKMSSNDVTSNTIYGQNSSSFKMKQDEDPFHQWSTSLGLLKLPNLKWNSYIVSADSGKTNVLEVPKNLSGRSASLTDINAKSVSNSNHLLDRYTLSVPSSPDSFYCDSLCSSGDLNSSTPSPLLCRSLSCEVLNEAGILLKQSRRSNSSDSAVVMLTEEDRISNQRDQSQFKVSDAKPQMSFLRSVKSFASSEEQRNHRGSESVQSPVFSMPSVVISDHSDFYPSFDEYSSFEDSLCGDSHIQYWHQFRKFSDCSSTSTQSLDEEEAEDQTLRTLDDDKCLLPSGWRKVRNIVHWSPFVQTYKKQKYPWVQLAGHKGSFKPGDHGTILKKLCPKEEKCLMRLMKDELCQFVPEYKGRIIGSDDEMYLQLQDLLKDFDDPCVMDCKIGVRTYLEEELSKAKEKAKLRKDMYEKMIQVDESAATEEEHRLKGVTKPRYMIWRETISSTATLGFRIDGMKRSNGLTSKDFKMTKSIEQVTNSFKIFMDGCNHVLPQYIQRLKELKVALERSSFFKTHELIGSSLLFVHDKVKANIWMIDFAKTQDLPDGITIDHKTPWNVGNHEDGYLIGIDNLINIFSSL